MSPTNNPYASPASVSHLVDARTHIKAIRAISRILRVVGWIGIVVYGSISAAAAISLVYQLLLASPDWINPFGEHSQSTLINIGVVLGYAGMAWIGSLFVRTGPRLLNRHRSAYREAMLLSILMLCIVPLTLFGIYNIVKLRRHWRSYCDEQAEMSRANL